MTRGAVAISTLFSAGIGKAERCNRRGVGKAAWLFRCPGRRRRSAGLSLPDAGRRAVRQRRILLGVVTVL